MMCRPQGYNSAGKNKSIFAIAPPEFELAKFDLKCCASTNCSTVSSIEITYMRPLDDNKVINVSSSLSSVRYQNINCLYSIYIQICQYISRGVSFKTAQTFLRCSLVCESGVEVETGRKFCTVSWFRTVTLCRICNVMFLLLTDSVNNRFLHAVGKR